MLPMQDGRRETSTHEWVGTSESPPISQQCSQSEHRVPKIQRCISARRLSSSQITQAAHQTQLCPSNLPKPCSYWRCSRFTRTSPDPSICFSSCRCSSAGPFSVPAKEKEGLAVASTSKIRPRISRNPLGHPQAQVGSGSAMLSPRSSVHAMAAPSEHHLPELRTGLCEKVLTPSPWLVTHCIG